MNLLPEKGLWRLQGLTAAASANELSPPRGGRRWAKPVRQKRAENALSSSYIRTLPQYRHQPLWMLESPQAIGQSDMHFIQIVHKKKKVASPACYVASSSVDDITEALRYSFWDTLVQPACPSLEKHGGSILPQQDVIRVGLRRGRT